MLFWIGLACIKSPQLPSFDYVVSRVEKTYPYDKMHPEWATQVSQSYSEAKKAKTPEELRPILVDLLDVLEMSHYGIIPALGTSGSPTQKIWREVGTLGFEVRQLEDQMIIVRVNPEHPDPSILHLGYGLKSIDGVPVLSSGSGLNSVIRLQPKLFCEEGQTVRVEFQVDDSRTQITKLPCIPLTGERFEFGNVPAQAADYHHREVEPGVHYIAFHHFLTPTRDAFAESIQELNTNEAKGLIIDLRGNTGGMISVGQGMVGYLISKEGLSFAQQIAHEAEFRYLIYPRPEDQVFKGPVVVLIDELSVSTAELFARVLQLSDRAVIIGTPSAGRVLSSMVEKLPNGDRLQLVIADLQSLDGQSIEGVGVVPDREVPYQLEALRLQNDMALLEGISWIHSQSGESK